MGDLEARILDLLLTGDHPVLEALRTQRSRARVTRREYSDIGCFTTFELPANVPAAQPASLELRDVWFRLDGCKEDGSAVLFVRRGRLDTLETSLHVDAWPSEVLPLRVGYLTAQRGGAERAATTWRLVRTEKRDLRYLEDQLTRNRKHP